MKRLFIFLTIITLSPFYTPLYSHSPAPFTKPFCYCDTQPPQLVSFKGSRSGSKVVLQWTVSDNEMADQFEVQKSVNGKEFEMAALVFGTDKPATDRYEFYEIAASGKVQYRIKLLGKKSTTEYSAVVTIDPPKQN
jgi:hypothetical protein